MLFSKPHLSVLIATTRRLTIAMLAFAMLAARGSVAQADHPVASAEGTNAAKKSAPKIEFVESALDVGQITAGTVVNHDYVFTNTGTVPLVITGVEPSCGCTSIGTWSASVEPGQTGTIPIQFDSTGFKGEINKWIIVASNDPDQPNAMLTLKGMIWDPIEVSPAHAIFTPVAGTLVSETKILRITNHTAEPVILSAPESTDHAFAVELKTVRPEKEFELRVTTVPPFGKGTLRDTIAIKTNSSRVPTLAITALVVVQQPVTVLPTDIRLRETPLASKLEERVTIRNNSAMTGLGISEPVVNRPDVSAVVKEVEPGRVFSVLVTFPAGFQLPAGEQAELKIKTTHPLFPVITVPIHQNPRSIEATANPHAVNSNEIENSSRVTHPAPVSAPK